MIRTLSALALVTGLALAAAPALAEAPAAAKETRPVPAVTATDRILGRADAPVTVIEYASFTCNHCADWHNTVLPQFRARYIDTGKVRLVFRDMPTQPVQVAATAAAVGRCAVPAKFFDVARSFMSGQAALFASRDAAAWFNEAISASGRTEAQIDACLGDPATQSAMQADISAAIAAGVSGTPTFFVNGRRVADPSLASLSAAIDPLVSGH